MSSEGTKKSTKSATPTTTSSTSASTVKKSAPRSQAFHDFYGEVFTPKRWARLYQALSQPTDLVALVNPYVPTRWAAKELNAVHAKPSTAFNSIFQKGLPIFELSNQTSVPILHSGTDTLGTNHSLDLDKTLTPNKNIEDKKQEEKNSLMDVEDKGFVSRWPVRLPQVGRQPGDNQLDIALATNTNGTEEPNDLSIDSDNPNQLEHVAMAGGFVSGFGPTRDKFGWYLMDLASIAAPLILNPQPGEKVLDLCAAPGGKSLILAYLMFFREKLNTKVEEISTIMQRYHDFTQMNATEHASAQSYTTWDDEVCFTPPTDFFQQYQTQIDTQIIDNFAQVTASPMISKKKSQRFLVRFEGIYDDYDENGVFINVDDLNTMNANNNIPTPSSTTAKSLVSYENDEIIQAILRSRNHSSLYKTRNELDREKHQKQTKPQDALNDDVQVLRNQTTTTTPEYDTSTFPPACVEQEYDEYGSPITTTNSLDTNDNMVLGAYDDGENDVLYDGNDMPPNNNISTNDNSNSNAIVNANSNANANAKTKKNHPSKKSNKILTNNLVSDDDNDDIDTNDEFKRQQIALTQEMYADLQYEREIRQLHSQILNPLALRKQMNISDTSDSDDDDDEELAKKAKKAKNKKNKALPTIVLPTQIRDETDQERRARVRSEKTLKKEQHEREKSAKKTEKAKIDVLRLRSRLVLNDVSIPRVKRLQKVIQSYLPMKYVPLVEITNVDASTAQQFTLITRNSYGDVSVKKIQKKGSGSALDSHEVRERMKEGEYDCVLVDAPCSSDRHIIHDNSLTTWNVAYTKAQAKRQYGLLLAAIKSLKIGGRCVYSTCSLSPFENDGVVNQVIKTLGDDVVKVIKFKLDLGEKTGRGWILLPDQPNCSWGPLYISLLQRVG